MIREWRILVNGPLPSEHSSEAHVYIRDDECWRHRAFASSEEIGDIRDFYLDDSYLDWPKEAPA